MELEWRKTFNANWDREETLYAGKIGVARVYRHIGTKNSPEQFGLTFLLPQIKESAGVSRMPVESIDGEKQRAESVVTGWFKACGVIQD